MKIKEKTNLIFIKEPTKAIIKCVVCNLDDSKGNHYGVKACESCKVSCLNIFLSYKVFI